MKTLLALVLSAACALAAPHPQCVEATVPNLVGLSYWDAVNRWRAANFASPVFPNRWCATVICELRVVDQSLAAGASECFYTPIEVYMQ